MTQDLYFIIGLVGVGSLTLLGPWIVIPIAKAFKDDGSYTTLEAVSYASLIWLGMAVAALLVWPVAIPALLVFVTAHLMFNRSEKKEEDVMPNGENPR